MSIYHVPTTKCCIHFKFKFQNVHCNTCHLLRNLSLDEKRYYLCYMSEANFQLPRRPWIKPKFELKSWISKKKSREQFNAISKSGQTCMMYVAILYLKDSYHLHKLLPHLEPSKHVTKIKHIPLNRMQFTGVARKIFIWKNRHQLHLCKWEWVLKVLATFLVMSTWIWINLLFLLSRWIKSLRKV